VSDGLLEHLFGSAPPDVQWVIDRSGVGWLTMNEPGAPCVLTPGSQRRMSQIVDDAQADPAVRVMVLSASQWGHAGTLARPSDHRSDAGSVIHGTERTANARAVRPWRVTDVLRGFTKPIIAAVTGLACGAGCQLAFMCDLVVAEEDSRFQLSECGCGGVADTDDWVLDPALGTQRAKEWLLFGEGMSAREARLFGTINRIVGPGALHEVAGELAEQIANLPSGVVAASKRAVDRNVGRDR
jgi:2-(1,2-epoxy-1,2-dihydrophenyl)acetyl-CoA isomerase